MSPPDRITLVLDIEPAADPIRGRLSTPDEEAQEFVGWLGLASAIERLLTLASHDG